MKIKFINPLVIIFLMLFSMACTRTKENEKLKEAIFKDFEPLKVDSIVYFDLMVDSGKVLYKFAPVENENTPFLTHIRLGSGEIKKQDDIIYISPTFEKVTIKELELFNFNLKKNEIKKCSFMVRDSTYTYELSLKDMNFSVQDSVFWFRIKNLTMIDCEFSNYFVSKKKGLIGTFESFYSDSTIINAFHVVGEIPVFFRDSIKKSIPPPGNG